MMTQKHLGLAMLVLAILILCASIVLRQTLLTVIGLALVPVGLMVSQRVVSKEKDGDGTDAG